MFKCRADLSDWKVVLWFSRLLLTLTEKADLLRLDKHPRDQQQDMQWFIWCYVSAIVLQRNVQSWNWTRPQSQQRKTLEITGSPYLTISCIACRTPRPNQSPNEPPTWICPKCVGWEKKSCHRRKKSAHCWLHKKGRGHHYLEKELSIFKWKEIYHKHLSL